MNIHMWTWDYWPGPEGGAERQCRGLARELVRIGHTVTVVCACTGRDFPKMDQGVRIQRLNRNIPRIMGKLKKREGLIPLSFLKNESLENAIRFWLEVPLGRKTRRQFIREIRSFYNGLEEKPDLIHVHETGWLAGLGCSLFEDIPVLAKIRNTPALEIIGYNVPRRKHWETLRKRCHWIALHEDLTREMIQSGGVPERITVVPNAVDVAGECPKTEWKGAQVLCVGNLTQGSAHKGFDVLIQAWGRVHLEYPDARLVILGRGDSESLKKLAKKERCEDAILFPGFVEDPSSYYQEASLFVLASNREGMSNALLEAQAYGLPAVVSDIPANRAVTIDRETGLFFSPGNSEDLSQKMGCLLKDPAKAEKMGKAAYQHMKNAFSRELVTGQLVDIYESLLKKTDEEP